MSKVIKSKVCISVILTVGLMILTYGGWNRYLMERAKDPGLSVRRLHEQGIDGRGISVAIIDGHLRTDHVEYHDQLIHYEELSNFEGIPYEAHGPSVASILVGKEIGVAPGAQLYYFAQNFAQATPADIAEVVRHILTFNEILPEGQRIRIVSISNGWPEQHDGVEEFKAAVGEAWRSGVIVIHSGKSTFTKPPLAIRTVGCPPWKDRDDPVNFGFPPEMKKYFRDQNQSVEEFLKDRARDDRDGGYLTLYVPGDYLTLAGPRQGMGGRVYGPEDYFYEVDGGLSLATPYLSGILALALQVNPKLTPEEVVELLATGVSELDNGMRLIAPEKVVELARLKLG